jgi:DNA-binding CsgD family transcriptional regulator
LKINLVITIAVQYICGMQVAIVKKNTVKISEDDVKTVKLYADGFRTSSVSKKMNVSPRTTEARVLTLKKKLKAKTLPHLVAILIRQQII